ncbi:hypothetical protein [Kitasatospora mediocidica]|uniref:hypothetical protein n=1 Tax=Kitasatospora mediocidica TaxID=58352 RepID=UPI00056239A5|nr:hypothetical protein [Kitasatospora mediocidica]
MRFYTARPGRRSYRPVTVRLAVDISGVLAFAGSAALTLALAAVGALHPNGFALGVFALFCAALGRISRPVAAPLIAGTAWCFLNGFVVHRDATLGWSGAGVEAARLGLFVLAGLLASLPGALPRRRIRAETWSLVELARSSRR